MDRSPSHAAAGRDRRERLDGLKWLKDEMTGNDIGVVLYSGHGGADASFDGFFFLPSDIEDEQISDGGISADLFKRALAEIPGRLVVLLNDYHAGAVGPASVPESQFPRHSSPRPIGCCSSFD